MLVNNLSFQYESGTPVLRDVSFQVQPGDCLAILGNNGAGKSTLLKCLNHILRPSSGTVMLDQADLLKLSNKEVARRLSFVAQRCNAGSMTVYDTVMLGRKPYMRLGVSTDDYRIVDDVITRMRLEPLVSHYLDELSGGEQQKVMLARALAQQPKVLLLDEPTSNLDLKNQYEVMRLVSEICRERQIAAVVVIHDLNLALRFCNKMLFLKDQEVYACGGPEIVTRETLEAVYGVGVEIRNLDGRKVVVVQS